MPKTDKAATTELKAPDKAVTRATHAAKARAWSATHKPGSDGRKRGRFGR